jgi:hypothetical protein
LADLTAHGKLVSALCAIEAQLAAVPVELLQLARASTVTAAGLAMCGATMFAPSSPPRVKLSSVHVTGDIVDHGLGGHLPGTSRHVTRRVRILNAQISQVFVLS